MNEALHFSDWAFHKVFGKPPKDVPIVPIGRDVSGLPVVYQGDQPSCLSCCLTFAQQWHEKTGPRLSWPFLAQNSGTTADGNVPSKVLESARKQGICQWDLFQTPAATEDALNHRLQSYAYISDYKNPQAIYQALQQDLVLIGLDEYAGVKDHAVIAYDVSEGGQTIKAVNWWSETVQELIEVPFSSVTKAVSLATIDSNTNPTMPFLTVIKDKVVSFLREKPLIALLAVVLGASLISGGTEPSQEQKYGQSGVALGYTTNVAAPGISSSIRSIPVSSITLYTGEVISTSTTIFPAYFVINPNGSTQELVECWGLTTTTTSPTWTDCNRGMSALGGPTTSTVSGAAFSHAAGERFVMTNAPAFFNRFVDIYTNQTVTGTKQFVSDIIKIGHGIIGAGQKIAFPNSQPNDPYFRILSNGATSTFYISFDGTSEFQLNASGTTFGASSTKGIFITGGLVGVNASSSFQLATGITGSIQFDTNGALYVSASGLSPSISVFGDGSDGDATINTNTTLTRDMYYENLTVTGTAVLDTGGYRIYVADTFTRGGTAVLRNNGGHGGRGQNGASTGTVMTLGGATATNAGAVTVPSSPTSTGGGYGQIRTGAPGFAAGSSSQPATDSPYALYAASTTFSGMGGNASSSAGNALGGLGIAGGITTVAPSLPHTLYTAQSFSLITGGQNITVIRPAGSSAGGGGGAASQSGSGVTQGGGGGAAGANGGVVFLAAKTMVDNGTSGNSIEAIGGNGGSGGNGYPHNIGNSAAGGGGAGPGGHGGCIIMIYLSKTGTWTTSVAAGSNGSGGTGAANGSGTADNGFAVSASPSAGAVYLITF